MESGQKASQPACHAAPLDVLCCQSRPGMLCRAC